MVRVTTRSGNVLEADVLLYCVGRDGNSRGLGLEAIGIMPDARGLLTVNEQFQTVHPHIYAVGDVIGYPALASTSMEQGRQAIRNAYGIPGPKLRTARLPFAIYAIPEVSYVGDTEETLKEKGIPYVVGRGHYEMNPKGQIVGAPGGLVKLLFERDTLALLGVHIIGHTRERADPHRAGVPRRRRRRGAHRRDALQLPDVLRHVPPRGAGGAQRA